MRCGRSILTVVLCLSGFGLTGCGVFSKVEPVRFEYEDEIRREAPRNEKPGYVL